MRAKYRSWEWRPKAPWNGRGGAYLEKGVLEKIRYFCYDNMFFPYFYSIKGFGSM